MFGDDKNWLHLEPNMQKCREISSDHSKSNSEQQLKYANSKRNHLADSKACKAWRREKEMMHSEILISRSMQDC